MQYENKPVKLMDQVRQKLRYKHYSIHTERTYCNWIKQYIFYHGKQHPKDLRAESVTNFLSYLANKRHVSASTQNQALSALVFLYREVLYMSLDDLGGFDYAKKPKKLPTVLTQQEAKSILNYLMEPYRTMVGLLYGSGLRLNECLSLRVLDIDLSRKEITVRRGKGNKDRRTVLPESVIPGIEDALAHAKALFDISMEQGIDYVYLPEGLAKKYPNAGKEFKWQYLFPSTNISVDPISGREARHHIHTKTIQRAINQAVKKAGVLKHVTAHAFRHSFATHLLESGYDIRTVQELMGHSNVNTTMIYTHVLNKGGRGVRSPMDSGL